MSRVWPGQNLLSSTSKESMGALFIFNLAQCLGTDGESKAKEQSTRACMLSRFSRVRLHATLWAVAHQLMLFSVFLLMLFSCLVVKSCLSLLQPMDKLLMSPTLAGRLCTTSAAWEAPRSKEGFVIGHAWASPITRPLTAFSSALTESWLSCRIRPRYHSQDSVDSSPANRIRLQSTSHFDTSLLQWWSCFCYSYFSEMGAFFQMNLKWNNLISF